MKFGNPAVTFAYHLGLHCTDENRLVGALMKNGDALRARKIIVPRPRRYRKKVQELISAHRGDPMPDEDQRAFFDELVQGQEAVRVVLSHDDFLSMPQRALEYGRLYGKTHFRSTWLRYLFPENPCEFHFAIRNPATLIPAVLQLPRMPAYQSFMKGADPRELRWSAMIEALQENNPGCPVIVWCNEDTPLTWPTVLREVAGVDPGTAMEGELDLLQSIMTEAGFARMQAYLGTHPPANEAQRRRIFAAFLDKFVIEEELEETIDLPGWTPEMVEEISARYDADVDRIERMPGVRFIAT